MNYWLIEGLLFLCVKDVLSASPEGNQPWQLQQRAQKPEHQYELGPSAPSSPCRPLPAAAQWCWCRPRLCSAYQRTAGTSGTCPLPARRCSPELQFQQPSCRWGSVLPNQNTKTKQFRRWIKNWNPILHNFLLLFLCLHTYVIEVVPGPNEAFPEGEDAAAPAGEEDHNLRQRQHVVDGADEAQRVCGNLLLQAAQPGLKQDGGDACRRSKESKTVPLTSTSGSTGSFPPSKPNL